MAHTIVPTSCSLCNGKHPYEPVTSPKGHNFIDITGQRFDRLTVQHLIGVYKRERYWCCLCSCGTACVVTRGNLVRGHTRSCSCLRKDIAINKVSNLSDINRINKELQQKKYSSSRKDKKKLYYLENKERIRLVQKEYLEKHPERHKKSTTQWAENNPEKVLNKARKWRESNIEKCRQRASNYQKSHPEEVRAKNARRRASIKGAKVNDLTKEQWIEIKRHYKYRCVYCNSKMKRLTMDHITPLSKGGSHTASNIVPACKICNSKKYNRAPLVPIQPLLLI